MEKIAELVGRKLTGKTCVGMKGVLEESSELLDGRAYDPSRMRLQLANRM